MALQSLHGASDSFFNLVTGNTVTVSSSSDDYLRSYNTAYGQVGAPSYRINNETHNHSFSETIGSVSLDIGASDTGSLTFSINGDTVNLSDLLASGEAEFTILAGTGGMKIVTDTADPNYGKLIDAGGSGSGNTGRLTLTPNGGIDSLMVQATADASGLLYELIADDSTPISHAVCLLRGTLIQTICGLLPIEDIRPGDLVYTRDDGYCPVLWSGNAQFNENRLNANPKLAPIFIKMGALGLNQPNQDLYVSRQHRMLVKSPIVKKMFNTSEVLIAANKLLGLPGISIADHIKEVDYFHILFDKHQIIYANGTPCESLFTGPQALKSVSKKSREEILAIFPEIMNIDPKTLHQARIFASHKRAKKLVERHKKNQHNQRLRLLS